MWSRRRRVPTWRRSTDSYGSVPATTSARSRAGPSPTAPDLYSPRNSCPLRLDVAVVGPGLGMTDGDTVASFALHLVEGEVGIVDHAFGRRRQTVQPAHADA